MGFVARVLSDFRRGGMQRVLWNPIFWTLTTKLFVYMENNQYPINLKFGLKPGSGIRPVQSPQLKHDSPLKCHMKQIVFSAWQ